MSSRRGSAGLVPLQRALLIVNPASRRGDASVRKASHAFAKLHVACDVVVSERRGHAGEIAAAMANEYDSIFSLGGDGTAIEVIAATTPFGPPVGILPGGTGNLLARALAIPMDVSKAVRTLVSGDEAHVDLGRLADGTRFAIGVGVGIDASMIASTSRAWKRRAGVLAYVVTGAKHAIKRPRFVAEIDVDGVVTRRQAAVVLIANFGVLLNGLITLGDGIRHDDGVLDVCLFDPISLTDALRISRKLLFRDFSSDPAMTYLRGRHITVSTDARLPVQADGELIGFTPIIATVEPLAARLLVPHCQINRH
ncbi:MAG: diacylglycerol kinase family protein [Gemmatimonadaceae bacterium]